MVQGTTRREDTGNPLQGDLGTPPKTRMALTGVNPGQAVTTTVSESDNLDLLNSGLTSMRNQKRNAEYLAGKAAAASGQTEAELHARGASRFEMAGMVEVEMGNMLSAWSHDMATDAQTNWSESSPEAYQERLSARTSELLSGISDEPFAQQQLVQGATDLVGKLSQAQRTAHQAFLETGMVNEYSHSLTLAADQSTTITRATSANPIAAPADGDFYEYSDSIIAGVLDIESVRQRQRQQPLAFVYGHGLGSVY